MFKKRRTLAAAVLLTAATGTTQGVAASTCSVIGGPRSPVYVNLYDDTKEGAKGRTLWENLPLTPNSGITITVSAEKLRYEYKTPTGQWSFETRASCRNDDTVRIP